MSERWECDVDGCTEVAEYRAKAKLGPPDYVCRDHKWFFEDSPGIVLQSIEDWLEEGA